MGPTAELDNLETRRQIMYYNVKLRRAHERAIRLTYSVGVFAALVIQQAKRMHRIILSSVACLAIT